jgi:hypothetical protein
LEDPHTSQIEGFACIEALCKHLSELLATASQPAEVEPPKSQTDLET